MYPTLFIIELYLNRDVKFAILYKKKKKTCQDEDQSWISFGESLKVG